MNTSPIHPMTVVEFDPQQKPGWGTVEALVSINGVLFRGIFTARQNGNGFQPPTEDDLRELLRTTPVTPLFETPGNIPAGLLHTVK